MYCAVLMRAAIGAAAAAENVVRMVLFSPWVCLPVQVYKIERKRVIKKRGRECVCLVFCALYSLILLFVISLLDQTIELSFRYRLFVTFLIIIFFFFIHNWLSIWYDATAAAWATVIVVVAVACPSARTLVHFPIHPSVCSIHSNYTIKEERKQANGRTNERTNEPLSAREQTLTIKTWFMIWFGVCEVSLEHVLLLYTHTQHTHIFIYPLERPKQCECVQVKVKVLKLNWLK